MKTKTKENWSRKETLLRVDDNKSLIHFLHLQVQTGNTNGKGFQTKSVPE